jgi:hypothetical protein
MTSQTLYVKNIQTILDNIGLSFIFRNQIILHENTLQNYDNSKFINKYY